MAYGQVNTPGASGADIKAARQFAQSAAQAAAQAQQTANEAQSTAGAALQKANEADGAARAAAGAAATAQQTANDAASAASAAAGAAAAAQQTANTANSTAQAAQEAAQNAQTTANALSQALTEINSTVNALPSQSGTLTYNGGSQSPTWNGFDSDKLSISGSTSGTNAGSYNVTFTPKEGVKWWDGTTTAKTATWQIKRADVTLPAQSGTLTYTGGSQSPTWNSNYNSNKMTLGGTTSGTNAGDYTANFTPGSNYQWPDGSTTAKSVTWKIGKAAGSLSLNPTSLSFTDKTAKTITATKSGGNVTASSSNTSVATVSVSGTTITVTPVADGTATITVSVAGTDNYTAPSNKTCSVSVSIPKIYGASWDGSSTTKWTRTDGAAGFVDPVPYKSGMTAAQCSSPFDTLQPWAGMVRSTDSAAGELVAIPKFYYKLTQNGNGLKVQISATSQTGFQVSPAHIDRGDGKGERSVVYIGRYHCHTSNFKSQTGGQPKTSVTRASFRTSIHNLGNTIWQSDFLMRFTLWLLYIVEYADWNSQATIGAGCSDNSSIMTMGYTDSMPYHTGTTKADRATYGGTQYRNIEGLWDNVYDFTDGCYNASNGLNIIKNPSSFSDSSGGTSIGTPSNGWPSKFTVATVAGVTMFYPSATGGSETTYSCDYWSFYAGNPVVCVGGSYGQSGNRGLFFVSYTSVSYSSGYLGSRLQKLP